MSTHHLYTQPVAADGWEVPLDGQARFSWEYDEHGRTHERLLGLYQKGKDRQWDQVHRIDWEQEVNPFDPLGLPVETIPIYGSRKLERLAREPARLDELRQHSVAWQFSQFLHGEQGAMICSARIVETVPGLDAKFYASTQTMDEARHAETYARFLQEKVGVVYPINTSLQTLLDQTLSDARWDMPYLGMQVLIEGLALAAFGLLRDATTNPLAHQILAYVMADEARHVAFGRIALREYYQELTSVELREREEFVVEGCYLMRDRLRAQEVWEHLELDVPECLEVVENSELMQEFRSLLFQRIVPCVRDIGLWGPRVQRAYADMGVAGYRDTDLDALMAIDEQTAAGLDTQRRASGAREAVTERMRAEEEASRVARGREIAATLTLGQDE